MAAVTAQNAHRAQSMTRQAIGESFRKLNPRWMMHNPVMLVVEVGSVFTTLDAIRLLVTGQGGLFSFTLQIAIWLWLTVLFSNYAEALAEGRGRAQADNLRATRTETMARRLTAAGTIESVPGPSLRKGDRVLVSAGEIVPSDGTILVGMASIDESAITGESAPVIRAAGVVRSWALFLGSVPARGR